MTSTRQQRMGSLLKEELSRIIREEMNDPRVGFISITEVKVTADLHTAYVYVSIYGSAEEQQATLSALESARKFLRGQLAKAVEMRYTPELVFHHDKSIERGARIFELLHEIEKTDKGASHE